MHLPQIEILLYLERKTSPEKRSEIEKHLADCRECSSALAEIYLLSGKTEEQGAPKLNREYAEQAKSLVKSRSNGKIKSRGISDHPAMVFIISVLFVASVIVLFYYSAGRHNTRIMEYRGNTSTNNDMGLVPKDGSVVSPELLNFGWNKIQNALEYKMRIFDLQGNIVFTKALTDTNISPSVKSEFIPGKIYLWNVTVYLPDGRSLKSGLQSFKFVKK